MALQPFIKTSEVRCKSESLTLEVGELKTGETSWKLENNIDVFLIHPGRLTWNLQITHLERKIILQTSVIMFHVNLPGCTLEDLWKLEENKRNEEQIKRISCLVFFIKEIVSGAFLWDFGFWGMQCQWSSWWIESLWVQGTKIVLMVKILQILRCMKSYESWRSLGRCRISAINTQKDEV